MNRGKCYTELAIDFQRQKERRIYFENQAKKDYERIKRIISNISDELNYSEYYSLAIAEASLGDFSSALKNIAKALTEIREEADIWKRDMNDYGEMKNLQYNIKKLLKEKRST